MPDQRSGPAFVPGVARHQARIVCLPCPVQVQVQCLAEALDHRIEFGMWGGMTERERRALLRHRPDVLSWAELPERAAGAGIWPLPRTPGWAQPGRPSADRAVTSAAQSRLTAG